MRSKRGRQIYQLFTGVRRHRLESGPFVPVTGDGNGPVTVPNRSQSGGNRRTLHPVKFAPLRCRCCRTWTYAERHRMLRVTCCSAHLFWSQRQSKLPPVVGGRTCMCYPTDRARGQLTSRSEVRRHRNCRVVTSRYWTTHIRDLPSCRQRSLDIQFVRLALS